MRTLYFNVVFKCVVSSHTSSHRISFLTIFIKYVQDRFDEKAHLALVRLAAHVVERGRIAYEVGDVGVGYEGQEIDRDCRNCDVVLVQFKGKFTNFVLVVCAIYEILEGRIVEGRQFGFLFQHNRFVQKDVFYQITVDIADCWALCHFVQDGLLFLFGR